MSFNVAIDTVLGLIAIYLALALICTSLNELIASLMRLRASNLHAEIDRLLGDRVLSDAFWAAGRIRALGRDGSVRVTAKTAPSYISATSFAETVVTVLREGGPDLEKIDAASPLKAVIDGASAKAGMASDAVTGTLATVFDEVMDRASGSYKRNIQIVSLTVATTLVVVLNVDTIAIARAFIENDELRGQAAILAATIEAPDFQSLRAATGLGGEIAALPLGWTDGRAFKASALLGWAMTALAVTLGAPFWFDVISKVSRLRGTGPAPK
jgi:hypothetical protein